MHTLEFGRNPAVLFNWAGGKSRNVSQGFRCSQVFHSHSISLSVKLGGPALSLGGKSIGRVLIVLQDCVQTSSWQFQRPWNDPTGLGLERNWKLVMLCSNQDMFKGPKVERIIKRVSQSDFLSCPQFTRERGKADF